jgi:ADP-ribose pyrophosphatase
VEKIVDSKYLYTGKHFKVKQLEVEFRPGTITQWEVVETNNSVAVVPLDDQGYVYLVQEYYPAVNERLISLPKGMVNPGETDVEAALRELQEEIGMKGKLRKLLTTSISPGYLTQKTALFLATDLVPSRLSGEEPYDIEVTKVHISQITQMILEGDISESRTLAGLLLVKSFWEEKTKIELE